MLLQLEHVSNRGELGRVVAPVTRGFEPVTDRIGQRAGDGHAPTAPARHLAILAGGGLHIGREIAHAGQLQQPAGEQEHIARLQLRDEALRTLDRVNAESETVAGSTFVRMADRAKDHLSAADKDVRVTIHDLSGAAIRELAERRADPRGDYAIPWFGEDDSGQLVPPGIYIISVDLDSDSGREKVATTVELAY